MEETWYTARQLGSSHDSRRSHSSSQATQRGRALQRFNHEIYLRAFHSILLGAWAWSPTWWWATVPPPYGCMMGHDQECWYDFTWAVKFGLSDGCGLWICMMGHHQHLHHSACNLRPITRTSLCCLVLALHLLCMYGTWACCSAKHLLLFLQDITQAKLLKYVLIHLRFHLAKKIIWFCFASYIIIILLYITQEKSIWTKAQAQRPQWFFSCHLLRPLACTTKGLFLHAQAKHIYNNHMIFI